MIDLHSHVLPGFDDGAADLDEALAIARAAAADGTRVLAATPHVREDYPTTADAMEAAVVELRNELRQEQVELELVGGGEIALAELQTRPFEELRRFGLAGNPGYLLLETPYLEWPASFEPAVRGLVRDGVTPVIGHPERNGDIQRNPELLRGLVDAGALVQVTAGSLAGSLGRSARRCAAQLLGLQLVHLVASDAHAPAVRAAGLSAAFRAVGDDELAIWLTESIPAAIVRGDELPPPPVRRRRGLLARLRGR